MYPIQERQLSLSSLFKKPIHNAVRRFSCFWIKTGLDISHEASPYADNSQEMSQDLIFYANCPSMEKFHSSC